MSRLLDGICYLRDILQQRDYKKIELYRYRITDIRQQLIRMMGKKAADYKFELEFTAQDLRELADDISTLFKYWNNKLDPKKNIKLIANQSTETVVKGRPTKNVDLNSWTESIEDIMKYRTLFCQQLTELLSICQFFSTYLYFIELASKDEFAINYTERLFNWENK